MRWRRSSVVGRKQQRLDLQQAVEAGALRVGEMVEAFGVQNGLALRWGEFAQAAEGAGNVAALVWRKIRELLHSGVHLSALRYGESLHCFIAIEQALTLGRRHGVEFGNAFPHALLGRWREVAKTGLLFEGLLLLVGSQVAVTTHPFGEMRAIGYGRSRFGACGRTRPAFYRSRLGIYVLLRMQRERSCRLSEDRSMWLGVQRRERSKHYPQG